MPSPDFFSTKGGRELEFRFLPDKDKNGTMLQIYFEGMNDCRDMSYDDRFLIVCAKHVNGMIIVFITEEVCDVVITVEPRNCAFKRLIKFTLSFFKPVYEDKKKYMPEFRVRYSGFLLYLI